MTVNQIKFWLWAVALLVVSTNAKVAYKLSSDGISNVIDDANSNTKNTQNIHIELPTVRPTTSPRNETETEKPTTPSSQSECSEDIHNTIDSKPCNPKPKVDNGTALILTPYIQDGRIEEGRNASRVLPELFLNVESYSGFVTVNKEHNSNMFFWYFPVQGRPVSTEPWIIWLQGGPGASSLVGLFEELGPFTLNESGKFVENPYTWLKQHSLVFIDNPVGSGFSFTDHPYGFVRDMDTYGDNLHEVVRQLVQLYPELQTAPLFIAGESYAGKYVPALATKIHQKPLNVNLKGIIVGNGFVEPRMVDNMAESYYNSGMISPEERELLGPLTAAYKRARQSGDGVKAQKAFNELTTGLLYISNQKQAYNFLKDHSPHGENLAPFLARSEIKKALHVGDIHYSVINITVYFNLGGDFISSAKPLYEELLEHYRVLIYCGQLDLVLACPRVSEEIRTWNWSKKEEFVKSHRMPFLVEKKFAMFVKTGGHLSEAVIRGAGHMAPGDTPGPAHHLVAAWTRGDPAGAANPAGASIDPDPPQYRMHRAFVHFLVAKALHAENKILEEKNNKTSDAVITERTDMSNDVAVVLY